MKSYTKEVNTVFLFYIEISQTTLSINIIIKGLKLPFEIVY